MKDLLLALLCFALLYVTVCLWLALYGGML